MFFSSLYFFATHAGVPVGTFISWHERKPSRQQGLLLAGLTLLSGARL